MTQDNEHIFCSCHLVRKAWQCIRRKVFGLKTRLGPPPIVSCDEFILFPRSIEKTKVLYLLGNYIQY